MAAPPLRIEREAAGARMRVTVTLEAVAGRPERYMMEGDPPAWRLGDVLDEPWPVSYGFIPGSHNPGDGEEWDVILLSPTAAPAMSGLEVEVIGVLLRADGDHKLLAALPGDEALGDPPDPSRLPPQQRTAIERLFSRAAPITGWAGREQALVLLLPGLSLRST